MNLYKVIFAKNEPISLQLLRTEVSSESYCYYEHDKGHLIFAMIKANSEREAQEMAGTLARDVETKVFGGNSIL